jgi:hypothetical protein
MKVIFRRPDGTFVVDLSGLPYHVLPDDPMFSAAQEAGAGAPLEPEPDMPSPMPITQLSFAQMVGGLVTEGWITKAEGKAWYRGTLPAQVVNLISALPEEEQIFAEGRAVQPTYVSITDPLVQGLAASYDKADELPLFFETYGRV